MTDLLNELEQAHGPVARTLSRLIRPALIAPTGTRLVWGDWSAIEARVLPWLSNSAGGEAVLDVFRQNDRDPERPDIYMIEAGRIYGKPPEEVPRKGPERQIGKVAVLALGFGGGVGALEAMATGYGIHIEPEFQRQIVQTWRNNNPWAVTFWDNLMGAFQHAWDNPGEVAEVGRVAYVFEPDYIYGTMFCYLPDGRPICYPALRAENITIEDEETGEEYKERRIRYQKGYGRASLWAGILAENITQATAASLLRNLLLTLDDSGWLEGKGRVVLHTHDEAVLEALSPHACEVEEYLKEQMETAPEWADGLPLLAETASHHRYSKTVG